MLNKRSHSMRGWDRVSDYFRADYQGIVQQTSNSLEKKMRFLGIPLTTGMTVEGAVAQAFACSQEELPINTTFVNPYSFHILKYDEAYKRNLERFRYVLPDGIGITWGLRLLHGCHTERISFDTTSLALPVLRRARQEGRTVMLVGGRPRTAYHAAERLREAVEGLDIITAVDGYRRFEEYLTLVRSMKPDVIVCGLGTPMQEEFLVRLGDSGGWKGLGYTCGGYFDQLRQGLQYYPVLVDRLNIRWLYRMVREPRRLWRRYMIDYQDFLAALALEAWHRGKGPPC